MKKGSQSVYDAETGERKHRLRKRTRRTPGDPPAVPRQPGDWAKELQLSMPPSVYIEAGRSTLTHTSWTGNGSRKWMSGQAAAMAAKKDRRQFGNRIEHSSLWDPILRSAGRPPSPLDFYLSWMSPVFHRFTASAPIVAGAIAACRRSTFSAW